VKILTAILNWENYDDSAEAIKSVLRSNLKSEIILIDNSSDDGSYEKLVELFGEQVIFHRNEKMAALRMETILPFYML